MTIGKTGLAVVALIASTAGAVAQQGRNCAPRDMVIARLAEKYSESRQSIGLGPGNQVVETFASTAGSWTITVTMTNGITCLVASGQAFEELAEMLPPKGDPA